MALVDANVILRYLLNDHPIMSQEAREIILSGAETTPEILAEVVYVLRGVYKVDRSSISAALESFLQEITIAQKPAIRYACRLFGTRSLDFVDCLLAGYHHMDGIEVITFDEKLGKVLLNDPLTPPSAENL